MDRHRRYRKSGNAAVKRCPLPSQASGETQRSKMNKKAQKAANGRETGGRSRKLEVGAETEVRRFAAFCNQVRPEPAKRFPAPLSEARTLLRVEQRWASALT